MNDKTIVCPCCKTKGFKGPNFERICLNAVNGSMQNVLACENCGVVFKENWGNALGENPIGTEPYLSPGDKINQKPQGFTELKYGKGK